MAKVKKEMAQGFASGELWDVLSDLVDDLNALKNLVNDLKVKYNAAVTLINELKADLSAHTHSGVTAGTDSTGAAAIISATDAATTAVADIALKTTK